MRKTFKNEIGITLIALVVTIIVLLILISIVANEFMKKGGIRDKVKQARNNTSYAQAEEEVKLAVSSVGIEEYVSLVNQDEKRESLEIELRKNEETSTVDINGQGFLIGHKGYYFNINGKKEIIGFDAKEWDKTAVPEECFEWESNTKGEEGYNTIIGCNKEIQKYPIVRIPSRCKEIGKVKDNWSNTNISGAEFLKDTEEIELPSTITTLKGYLLSNGYYSGPHNAKSITIPNSVTSIEDNAFYCWSNLERIKMPDSITNVGPYAFENTKWYKSQPDGMIYVGKVAYKYKGEMPSETNITLKEGTIGIARNAFSYCSNLKDIKIPNSVLYIEECAFLYCSNLTSIIIPNSVIEIRNNAFGNCQNLVDIDMSGNIEKIGDYVFSNTKWYNNQQDGVVYIGTVAYKYKGEMPENTNIVINEGTKVIADSAFSSTDNNLASIVIPEGVINIGVSAFYKCDKLTRVNLPSSIKAIGAGAFQECTSLNEIIIPNKMTNVVERTFALCDSLANVTIPEGITTIGEKAFSNCKSLISITIPSSVTSIYENTFDECDNLENINIRKASNSIKGGPWGAPKAIVNWDYKG